MIGRCLEYELWLEAECYGGGRKPRGNIATNCVSKTLSKNANTLLSVLHVLGVRAEYVWRLHLED